MKNTNWLFMVLLSLCMSSCGLNLYLPTEEDSASTNTNTKTNKTPTKPSTPAPDSPLPPPANQGSSTRSNTAENAALYQKLNLSATQINQFEEIAKKYEQKTRVMQLKYKAKQSLLKQELKKLDSQREEEIKGIMSNAQYQNYLKVMKDEKGKAKGSIGG